MGVKTGQTSLWFFTCICLLWYTWRTGASKLNALSLVVSTFKLQYSIFFVIPHVAQRKWRTLLWICLFQLAFVLAACLNVGWKNIIDYPQFLLSTETSGAMGVAPESMSNFGALLLRYLPKTSALIGTLSVLAASLIYLFSVWWRWAKIPKKNDGWPIAVTCVLALVASPHTHFHMCVLLVRCGGSRHPKNYQPDEMPGDPCVAYRLWALLLIYYPCLSWLIVMTTETSPVPISATLNLVFAALAIANTEIDFRSSGAPVAAE